MRTRLAMMLLGEVSLLAVARLEVRRQRTLNGLHSCDWVFESSRWVIPEEREREKEVEMAVDKVWNVEEAGKMLSGEKSCGDALIAGKLELW